MKVRKLISASYGEVAAEAYEAFVPSEAEMATLRKVGEDALRIFGPVTHACAPMSAAYTARLQYEIKVPVYMIAGSLKVRDRWIYGDGRPIDGKKIFGGSNPSWDGHAWVMFGPYVADVSVRQTALSGRSHPLLAALVRKSFGDSPGLLIMKWTEAPQAGFYFAPQYVLSDQEVTNLFLGAKKLFGISRQ
jgi:hypothetical protein